MSNKTDQRDMIIMAALPHVLFDGWTIKALKLGAKEAGFEETLVDRLFSGEPRSAVRHWLDLADRMMLEDIAKVDLDAMRIRDRIAFIVRTRLQRWIPHREAVRRAVALSLLPGFAEDSLLAGYSTIDAMWRAAGDRSTDYNYYTKRGLLAAVYTSTLLVWLNDKSDGCSNTWAFLDRRIANVMGIPKAQARIRNVVDRFPNPIEMLCRVLKKAV